MDATWGRRELPVLEEIIGHLDVGEWPEGEDIAARTGLSLDDVRAALRALDGHYIDLTAPGNDPPTVRTCLNDDPG